MMGVLKMEALLLGAVLSCGAVQAAATEDACAGYGRELAAMAGAEAALRARVDLLAPPEDAGQARRIGQLALVERSNRERLLALLARCGWPLRADHGAQAGKDAWQLVRRVEGDLPLQQAVARRLEQAVARGDAAGPELARLQDRIAVAEGRPQPYGTQLYQPDACRWTARPMDNRVEVEARRRQLGLPTLDEQERLANGMVIHEGCQNSASLAPAAIIQ